MDLEKAIFDLSQILRQKISLIWSTICNKVESFANSAFTSSVPIATNSSLLYIRSLSQILEKNRTKIRNMHVLGFYPVR